MSVCIVIDTDVLGCVFDPANTRHSNYIPVTDWITKGEGFLVLGGTEYLRQLRDAPRYYKVMVELKKMGRVMRIRDVLVDEQCKQVWLLLGSNTRCDDAHLIAIIRASGCRLICSNDKRADTYLKNKRYYLRRQKPPSIYRNSDHRHLLCRRNIVNIRGT